MCTKPGVLIAPENSGILDSAAAALAGLDPVTLLTDRITGAFAEGTKSLSGLPGARVVVSRSGHLAHTGLGTPSSVLATGGSGIEECFGYGGHRDRVPGCGRHRRDRPRARTEPHGDDSRW
ncbi:hypothetical protein HEP87_63830 [Streptomyces sp. S1D4-11]